MNEDNVVSLNAYRLANEILELWSASMSDNGAIYERKRAELTPIKEATPEDVWAQAVTIAQRRWGQS